MKVVGYTAWVLIVIGGLNWGLVGAFEYNLVDSIFGEGSVLAAAVYIVVGLAALYSIIDLAMQQNKKAA